MILLIAKDFSQIATLLAKISSDIYKRLDAEESDDETREAQFAFHSQDLNFFKNSIVTSKAAAADENTNWTMTEFQHWALVVHFPKGEKNAEKIYKFEAGKNQEGFVGYSRFKNVDQNEFDQAMYFGTAVTSPRKLLEIAEEISPNGKVLYSLCKNDCQTWTKAFLNKVSENSPQGSTNLYQSLQAKRFARTRSGLFNSIDEVLKRAGIPMMKVHL
uniref:Uncharacterized protein n=1 Tax=Daphnia galeata TaxID=27404 RepID=A0A8J2RWB6_9CRUS|nr:unnamed protein product [Daphnia galeata]